MPLYNSKVGQKQGRSSKLFENQTPPPHNFPIIFFPKVTPRIARYFARNAAHVKFFKRFQLVLMKFSTLALVIL